MNLVGTWSNLQRSPLGVKGCLSPDQQSSYPGELFNIVVYFRSNALPVSPTVALTLLMTATACSPL